MRQRPEASAGTQSSGSAESTQGVGSRVPQRLHRHTGLLALGIGVVFAVVGAGAAASVMLRPSLSLRPSRHALASVTLTGADVHMLSANASVGASSFPLHWSNNGAQQVLLSHSALPAGQTITVDASASPAHWLTWLWGSRLSAKTTVKVPAVSLTRTTEAVSTGDKLRADFSQPVSVVEWTLGGRRHTMHLQQPSAKVAIGSPLPQGVSGSVQIRAAVHSWAELSKAETLSFFAGSGTLMTASPAPGGFLASAGAPIQLRFSRPVAQAFGSNLPRLSIHLLGAPKGTWSRPNPYTLRFIPAPGAIWPGQSLAVTLPKAVQLAERSAPGQAQVAAQSKPVQKFTYSLPAGSLLRAQQLLAQLGYLPLTWHRATTTPPAGNIPTEQARSLSAPPGSFSWTWSTPPRLASMWSPGSDTVMTKGAIRAFEHVAGLDPIGQANPLFWPTLAQDALAHKVNPNGYSWVDVTKTLPEHMVLWHNGKTVLTSLVNTGIPSLPTANGTYPVYLRYKFQIMKGTNPNGSHYADPVHWISYFNGGDAVHGFVRASYGFPQSLGCVELPVATAKTVWPYLHIGSLVTVH